MPLWRKLNILGWDLQVGWWLQYISVTRLISWYNISHVLKVYFILLQRFRLVIMSDHSSEPVLVSHCPMPNFLFAVVWCSAVFVGNIESSYFGSYWSPNDPVSRSWHECWYYRISGHLWIKPLTLMNRTKTQTNEKTKTKNKKQNRQPEGLYIPGSGMLYLVGHFWVPNVHYSVVSGLPCVNVLFVLFCFTIFSVGGENVFCFTLFECFDKHRKVLIPNNICIFIKHILNGRFI